MANKNAGAVVVRVCKLYKGILGLEMERIVYMNACIA